MLSTDMSSSMSMEGAELVDGMAAEVDYVGSRLLCSRRKPGRNSRSLVKTGHASPPEIPGSATGCSNFFRSLCYLLQPPVGPSCLEARCAGAGSTLSTGKSTMCVRLHVRSQRVSEGGFKVALACTSFQCCKLAL